LEFGYAFGTTGDYRYDLGSNGTPGYRTFNNFSFDYGPFFAFFIYIFAQLFISIMYAGAN
jgi:YidC/Oxa1 family membrane protein insertase